MNDLRSLRSLGVEGEIFCVKGSGAGFHDFINRFRKEKELIVMTDFDNEGRELSRTLTRELCHMRIKADSSIRSQMEGLVKSEIKGVEELAGYIEKVKTAS